MKPRQFFNPRSVCVAALCLLLKPVTAMSGDTFEDGPAETYRESADAHEPWQARAVELPAYPEKTGSLIELNISTAGLPYRLYVDPASLTVGDDRVVRFTTVMISPTGVWNVSYEGLHCGERTYRRLAYGSTGEWHPLKNSPWLPVTGQGVNQYRKFLYEVYLCDTTAGYKGADELVRKLRFKNPINDTE
jgi:hypothetical protein